MATATVAELVDTLFLTRRRPDGQQYSNAEVVALLRERYGITMDPSYITKVRSGAIKNPGREALLLFCQFFEVPPSYFFPELDQRNDTDNPQMQIRSALQSLGMSAETQVYIEGLITELQKLKR